MHIALEDATAWADQVKLRLDDLDNDLEGQQADQVLAGVAQAYNTSTWTDDSNTPALIKKIIAMMYVGWLYQRTYSEDSNINAYGLLLLSQAQNLINGIANGTIVLPDAPEGSSSNVSLPEFYPTDTSSAMRPTFADPSLGGPAFSMGQIW